MPISPARTAAFDVLFQIETDNGFSADLLPSAEAALSDRDRSLCHELTLGTLRRQIYLDRITDGLAGGKKLDAVVRIAIRMGLYQMIFLDKIPMYSALNESVELVRRAKKRSATGFVNAILRRVSRENTQAGFTDELDRISVETSHPAWLLERWAAEFGNEVAEKIAVANNEMPTTAFRFTAAYDNAGRPAISDEFPASELVDGCFFGPRTSAELRSLDENGMIYFQDEASQMVASAVNVGGDDTVLDLCASPGSKTGSIARQHARTLIAGDNRGPRIEVLRDNLARQGVENVLICQYDAERTLPFADESFDVVLVDAPCTGTGTIRHNPEIRYRLKESDFATRSRKQLRILKNASKLLKPGGRLVYSTCSLERDENEGVATRFLSEAADLELRRPDVPERFITAEGFARTFPHRDDMDGFFIAAFERMASKR